MRKLLVLTAISLAPLLNAFSAHAITLNVTGLPWHALATGLATEPMNRIGHRTVICMLTIRGSRHHVEDVRLLSPNP